MDTAECEALINAVSKRPGLYDKTSKMYANRQYAVQAWRDIREETNLEETAAKRKWSNLRDYFQRQLKETHTTKSGSAPAKKRKWVLYDAMSFLIKYIADRQTFGNLQASSRSLETVTDNGDDEEDEVNLQTFSQDTPTLKAEVSPVASSSASSVDAYTESTSKRKNGSRKNKDESQTRDREVLETLRNIQPKPTMEENEDLLFFKNLVPKMKGMTDVQKLELQTDINNVFLKHLKRAAGPSPYRNADSGSGRRSVCYEYTTSPDNE